MLRLPPQSTYASCGVPASYASIDTTFMTLILTTLAGFLPVIQVVLGLLIVGGVLLQTRGAGLGAFADSTNQTYYKRRGGELFLFRATAVLGVLFVLAALLSLVAQ